MMRRGFTPLLFVLLSCGVWAQSDHIVLKDGRVVEGLRIDRSEGGFDLHFKSGDIFVPEKLVREVLIEADGGYKAKNAAEQARLDKGFLPYNGKWVRKKQRDRLIKKKRERLRKKLEESKKHHKWNSRYRKGSKHFFFEYTIDPEICKGLQDLMETYYKVFTKEWKIRPPPKLGRLKVCFYHDYDYFLQVSGVGRGVLGYYRFVKPFELNFFYDRVDPEFTTEVMFHEANHYLTHLIDLNFHYPHCINEAMAEYYGASKWDPKRKKMSTGHILEGRLTEVLTDIQGGEMKKVRDYLTNKLGYHDYTWGWSFVHFMMETKKYRKRWKRFFIGLARDKRVKRIGRGRGGKSIPDGEILRYFQLVMKVKDLDALEKEWHAYIKQNLKLSSHRGYEKAARAAASTGQSKKARRYYKLAVEKGSKNPKVYSRYAKILWNEGHYAEAKALVKKALIIDPLSASLYVDLAQIARREGGEKGKKEAARYYNLAKEIDPENMDLLVSEALLKLSKS